MTKGVTECLLPRPLLWGSCREQTKADNVPHTSSLATGLAGQLYELGLLADAASEMGNLVVGGAVVP